MKTEGQNQEEAGAATVQEGEEQTFRYTFRSTHRPAGDPLAREVTVWARSLKEARQLAFEKEGFDVRKERAEVDMDSEAPEKVEAERAQKVRLKPMVDAVRQGLSEAGVDMSRVTDDLLEGFVKVGGQVFGGALFRKHQNVYGAAEASQGLGACDGGPSGMKAVQAPGTRIPGAGFAPFPEFGPAGGFNGFGAPGPFESFALGQGPGMAEQSAFGYMVRVHQERQRKIRLFREILAGAAYWLADYVQPQPHPFDAFGDVRREWPAAGPLQGLGEAPGSPGEGF